MWYVVCEQCLGEGVCELVWLCDVVLEQVWFGVQWCGEVGLYVVFVIGGYGNVDCDYQCLVVGVCDVFE